MKSLVIAEKPSVAGYRQVLKCDRQINGAIEGSAYIVTWGLGHLVELADPGRRSIPNIKSGRWRTAP